MRDDLGAFLSCRPSYMGMYLYNMTSSSLKATWHKIHLEGIPANLTARSSHNLTLLDGRAYIFGGELSPRTPIGDEVLVIDLKETSKSTSSTMNAKCNIIHKPSNSTQQQWPNARVGAAMTAHPATKSLLLWGGRGGKEMKAIDVRTGNDQTEEHVEDVWKFDIRSNTWSQLQTNAKHSSDFPVARSFHTITSTTNAKGEGDQVYVHAGCPAQGRLSSLNALDLKTLTWTALPTGPDPGRGGTVVIPIRATKQDEPNLLARWGGFCGFELGGPLEIFEQATNNWTSYETFIEGQSDKEPAKRSVHGFIPYNLTSSEILTITIDSKRKQILAIMFMGEGEGAPKELGHDGAGKFLNDVYALLRSEDGIYTWLPLPVHSEIPEPRGWFAFDAQPTQDGLGVEIVVHGGLNESNERLSDAWILRITD